MNSDHTVKKADQEISFIADKIHQVEKKSAILQTDGSLVFEQSIKEYERSHQLLEFHVKTLNQMIKTLSAAKAHMKNESENSYRMNIVTESARRAE